MLQSYVYIWLKNNANVCLHHIYINNSILLYFFEFNIFQNVQKNIEVPISKFLKQECMYGEPETLFCSNTLFILRVCENSKKVKTYIWERI